MRKSQLAASAAGAVLAALIGPGEALGRDYGAFLAKAAANGLDGLTYQDGETVNIQELKKTIDEIGAAFQAFKQSNDEALAEAKKHGQEMPETQAKVAKIEKDLGELVTLKADLDKALDRLNRPPLGGGQQGDDWTDEARAHKAAWLQWAREPQNGALIGALKQTQEAYIAQQVAAADELGYQSVLIATPGAGGYAVPEMIASRISEKIVDLSPMRRKARVVRAGTSDYKELVDVGGEGYEWVGESDTRNETATPGLEEVAPSFGTISTYPKASEESLMDIFFDVENWVVNRASRGIAKGEGVAFTTGNGTKKPTGFLNGTPVAIGDEDSPARAFGTLQYIASGAAAGFPNASGSPAVNPGDALLDVVYALKRDYRAGATWQSNKATLGTVRKFKNTEGDYIWQPGLAMGQPQTLLGYPVDESEDMPDIAANAFPLAFGDWMEAYLIVDLGGGLRMTRDEVTQPGFVKFYVRRRVGGKLLNDDALKLLKIATS